MNCYPVFLNLEGKKVVVVGGGSVATRKVNILLKSGANITVISPSITKSLKTLKQKGAIKHTNRTYKKNDLKAAFLVIAATSSLEENIKIAMDAKSLINVVDMPSHGNFIVPSIINRGPLTIAVSTSGISPAMAKAIRRELEKLYCTEFSRYLIFLKKIRTKALKEIKDKEVRAQFLKDLVSNRIFKRLRRGDHMAIKNEIIAKLKSCSAQK